ncbi:MAG TPA: phospholipase D-like domain-containing protein [Humisphaera sp.]
MLTVGSKAKDAVRQRGRTPAEMPPRQAGFSPGININPDHDDDGWCVPEPVTLGCGTSIQLYKDGEALHAAFTAIEAAKRRVLVEMYIFADDATGQAFADLLARKSRQGVRVLCVYDAFASRRWAGLGPETTALRTMRDAGVRLEAFHPVRPWECRFAWHPFNRNHRKLFVVDDAVAGMGGLNIGTEYAGAWIVSDAKGEFWRDNGVQVTGPGVRLFVNAFTQTWHYVQRGGRLRKLAYAEHLNDDADLGVLASAPTVSSEFRPMITKLLCGAQRSITLTMAYFAPDDPMVDALCDRARAGVRVRLMFPGVSDVAMVRIAGRAFYDRLLEAGCEVYERQHAVLHAKTLCIDGRTTVIGSANLDYRSIELNCELSAIVRNAEFGGQIEDLFDNDVRYARRITKKEWRRVHAWDRFVMWAVSRARYVL